MLAHLPTGDIRRRTPTPLLVGANTPLPHAPPSVLRFDGSCPRNPGPMGIGYIIYNASDDSIGTRVPSLPLVRVGAQIGDGTNNEAEYQAFLAGLRHALKLGLWDLHVQSDSKLVVEQIGGRWKVRDKRLALLHREAENLIRLFNTFYIKHVYREANADADELSRKLVFEEPSLPLPAGGQTSRFPKALHDWQAAAIRVWSLTIHPGIGTLSRVFGIAPSAIEQIVYGKSYRSASFDGYELAQITIHRPSYAPTTDPAEHAPLP